MESHVTKKARYEQPEDEMSLQQPHVTSSGRSHFLPSEDVGESLNENRPHSQEEEDEATTERVSSSMDYFQNLRRREWCDDEDNRKLPNIFREYHLRAFDFKFRMEITNFLVVRDILFVIYVYDYIVPVRLYGEMSQITDKHGSSITIQFDSIDSIDSMWYNCHNNSLIVKGTTINDNDHDMSILVSLDVASIEAGKYPEERELFREDLIQDCDFDFPNCRGMIYDKNERVFKFFELKEYTELFRIPDSTDKNLRSKCRFGSPGNTDMLIIIENKNEDERTEVLLRIYSKATGQLRKEISIPVTPQRSIEFLHLCGPDRIFVHQRRLEMQVMDISSEICKIIKSTDILLARPPLYLAKRSGVLCITETSVYLCDLQGEIVVTFEDHSVFDSYYGKGSYVTTEEDILISACGVGEHADSINISSIVTGKRLGKITTHDPNSVSALRELAFEDMQTNAFVYDERTHDIISGDTNGIIYVWSNKLCRDVPLSISKDDESEGGDMEAGQ